MSRHEEDLLPRVRAACEAHSLLSPGDVVLVAVSGGVDSMALLHVLLALCAELPAAVHVAHYEHGIRGEASRGDAAFVEAFCVARGIPVHLGQGDVPAMAKALRCSVEDAARRARYAHLDAVADRIGAGRIALAHHRQDQAETILLHLVRGSGAQGLAGMRWRRGRYIRPLLDTSRAEIEAYAARLGIDWREDATNADTHHARNLIRHEVLPVLRRVNPAVDEAIARTGSLMAALQDEVSARSEGLLAGCTHRMPYGAYWLAGEGSLDAEALRCFIAQETGSTPEMSHVEAVLALEPGGVSNLLGGWRAMRTRTRLHLLSPTPRLPEMGTIARAEAKGGGTGDGLYEQVLDAQVAEGAAFRFRRAGDVFAPLGMQGTQKLKQTLRDAGIDEPFRDLVPVLAKGSHILWIVGVKAGRDAAITEGTRARVRYTYHGKLPWVEERS